MNNGLAGFSLVEWSIRRPKRVVALAVVLTAAFGTQFPKLKTDTNPKNMLPATSDVRMWNDEVDQTFALYEDTIVVGVAREDGVLNPDTLAKIARITDEAGTIPGVAAKDVTSLKNVDNVTAAEGMLKVSPLMAEVPQSQEEVEALKRTIFANPLLIGRLISRDGNTTAVYVPLERGADGKKIADDLRRTVGKLKGPEAYYIAGDPVARDTFGAEMFKLMGLFSPLAGMIMLAAIYLMFRSLSLAFLVMGVAMIAIVWSVGLLIGLGFPIHIMSSMSPVFLMAIATDSIHIFNEFYFRYRERKNKAQAIRETMSAVGRPVRYTALATAAGFAVLLFMHIIPVRVFGGLVAFGTVALRLLSFSLVPAILTFVSEEKMERASRTEDVGADRAARWLRSLGDLGARHPAATVLAGLAALALAVAGATRTVVNNNMVNWFKAGSEVRTADRVMNEALGGTSLAYIVASSHEEDSIKTPEALRYIEGLQRDLEKLPLVGKTTSVVDYVKRINRVLHGDDPRYDTVPDSREEIAQYLFLFGMSAKPADLDNVVDYRFQKANIWIQLKTWDARAMRGVIAAQDAYARASPFPLELKPAGTAYFNLVWNDEVLWDMVKGFGLALVVVFVILVFNFRSFKWAVVGYVPLLFTILLIYGVLGFAGKDFDMPISVLSCLSLGMAVDFAIHFISRLKQRLAEIGHESGRAPDTEVLLEALRWTAARPGKGIMRNAVLFASAFSVMLFAPLTPYVTVGGFIAGMMTLSALMTILYLPALIVLFKGSLFGRAS
ncbi:MAG: MMPL family transporter [Nitrospirae bacterium]|nr:MMPL family transporter [Nitrospirota bacterium]